MTRAVYVATFPLTIFALVVQPLLLIPNVLPHPIASRPWLQMALGYALAIVETVAGYRCRRRTA